MLATRPNINTIAITRTFDGIEGACAQYLTSRRHDLGRQKR